MPLFRGLVTASATALCVLAAALPTAGAPVSVDDVKWEFAGWYGGGAFPNVEFDPVNPDRYYVTSDVAGLWRSEDRGESWFPINQGMPQLDISSVVVAPSDNSILYAAAADGVYLSSNFGGLWRSTEKAIAKLTFRRPQSYKPIAVHPTRSENVCAGSSRGTVVCSESSGRAWKDLDAARALDLGAHVSVVKFSIDGGSLYVAAGQRLVKYDFSSRTWSKLLKVDYEISDFALAGSPSILVVAGGRELLLSDDGGSTWSESEPLPRGITHRVEVSGEGETLTLLTSFREGWKSGLFHSSDRGKTWDIRGERLVDMKLNPTRAWQGRTPFLSLRFSPHDAKVVLGTDYWGVFKSSDGGRIFHEKINGLANTVGSDIFIDTDSNIWVATMDDGLLMSPDHGKSYVPVLPHDRYDPLISGHFWRIQDISKRALMVTSSPWNREINQVFLVDKKTLAFEPVTSGFPSNRPRKDTLWREGYPRGIAVGGVNGQTIYVAIDGAGGGVFYSDDGGQNFKALEEKPPSLRVYNALAAEKTSSGRVFLGSCGKDGGVAFYENGHWIKGQIATNCVFDLKLSQDGTLYAAGAKGGGAVLYRSRDRGQTFEEILKDSNGRAFEGLAIHPHDTSLVAVSLVYWGGGAPGRIFLSSNFGDDWVDITGNLPVSPGAAAMAFDPNYRSKLFVSLYAGSVYASNLESVRPTSR